MLKEQIWDKISKLKSEDYLNVSKEENIKQLERLDKLEEQVIELGLEQEVLESEILEYRAELYYEIYFRKKMMTKKEFLEDTIAYYSEDVNRRCIKGTKCLYSPLNADKKGISKGCAIGRHLDEELQLTLDDADYTSVNGDEVFDSLPTWMQDLGQDFLYDVQGLHDLKNYWSDKGLSSDGLKFVEIIKQKYDI